MESHIGTQTHLIRSQEDEDDSRGRMDQLIQFLQERMHPEEEEDDDDDEDEKIEAEEGKGEEQEEEKERGTVEEEHGEEEEGSLIGSQYHEVGNYFNQPSSSMYPSSSMHTASPSTTWSYRDNETVDDSDIITSASSPQPSHSQSFYRDGRQYSSSANPHSIVCFYLYLYMF